MLDDEIVDIVTDVKRKVYKANINLLNKKYVLCFLKYR